MVKKFGHITFQHEKQFHMPTKSNKILRNYREKIVIQFRNVRFDLGCRSVNCFANAKGILNPPCVARKADHTIAK